MTVAELYRQLEGGGTATLAGIALFPIAIGVVAWMFKAIGKLPLSQAIANFGIALGLAMFGIEILALMYAVDHLDVHPLDEVPISLLFAPAYITAVAFFAEHLVHPGKQAGIRKQLRGGLLVVIVLGVLYFILSHLNMHMIIWSNIFGFIMFILVIIAVLYAVVRKVV